MTKLMEAFLKLNECAHEAGGEILKVVMTKIVFEETKKEVSNQNIYHDVKRVFLGYKPSNKLLGIEVELIDDTCPCCGKKI